MFAQLRKALNDLADGVIPPSERSGEVARMRQTLVQARVALEDMSAALTKTRDSLAAQQAELETVRRRRGQAEKIGDSETIAIATRFEEKHAQLVEILLRKLAVQEEELRVAEAEVAGMTNDFKAYAKGFERTPDSDASREAASILDEAQNLQRDIDGLARQRVRQEREASAESRLAELKKRMGK